MIGADAMERPPYFRFVGAVFRCSVSTIARRKRTLLAAIVCLLPVAVPVAVSFVRAETPAYAGIELFVTLSETLLLAALAPLMALFLATMLLGEEVESQTMPYLLIRPMPRGALVLGKFLAYWCVASLLLLPAVWMTYAACAAAGGMDVSRATLLLTCHYCAVIAMALLGYGGLCMLLGALFKKPVIAGIVLVFGWERLANIVPGYIDFLTIEKYVRALLPLLPTERAKPSFQTALGMYAKEELLIRPVSAAVILIAIAALLIGLTTLTVRRREYANARVVNGG